MNAVRDSLSWPGADAAALRREARRQRGLVQAVFAAQAATEPSPAIAVRQCGGDWTAGLAAYRANGLAHAAAALRVQFPTVLAMLGEQAFDAIVARYRRDWPPTQGDFARIGAQFPLCLTVQEELRPWPWLADSARLDLALWQVMDEPPAVFATDDLQRLARGDPARLRLPLAPGTRLVASRWPIVTLWRLHQAPAPDHATLREAMQQPGETAWVWRGNWQAYCAGISAGEAQWLQSLGTSPTLGDALDGAPDDFDPAAWLHDAARHGWIDTVRKPAEANSRGRPAHHT